MKETDLCDFMVDNSFWAVSMSSNLVRVIFEVIRFLFVSDPSPKKSDNFAFVGRFLRRTLVGFVGPGGRGGGSWSNKKLVGVE